MDALLRYILYQIAFTLLTTELIIMVVCCFSIVVIKCMTKKITNRRESIQDQLTGIFQTALFDQKPIEDLTIPSSLQQFRNLVEVLEKFDQRFNDPRWIQIKERVVKTYLQPHLQKYASSYFSWFKRQLAARSCLLCPNLADEKILAKLLQDSRYLVRVTAAVCVTQTSYHNLFNEVIRQMSKETHLSRFPYRDALIQVNQEKYMWIESMLKTETDPAIIAVCLDILSTRYSGNLMPLIKPHFNSGNKECRRLAIKALGNIPSHESIEILMAHLVDSDWEIRADSIIELKKLNATQAISNIGLLLNDPVWWVRLQAGLALKDFGKNGLEVLSHQDPVEQPKAYEIAQYTLALP